MIKKISLFIAIAMISVLASFSAFASSGSLTFTTETAENLPEASDEAVLLPDKGFTPYINDNGTFDFTTSGQSGDYDDATLVSEKFGFSSSTSHISIKAYGLPDSYTVYLEKKGIMGWSTVKTVTYHTGDKTYGYTFENLSKSSTYRLRFYSPDGTVSGSGTIENYRQKK